MARPSLFLLSTLAGALFAALVAACTDPGAVRPPPKPPVAAASAPSASSSALAAGPAAAPSASAEQPPSPLSDPFGPLDAKLRTDLLAIAADPTPKSITLNTHYVVSNEDKPQAFHDASTGRGGVYVGVGAEQAYLFGGWARSELLFLMDFDDWVVDINEIYGILFERARTPDELFELWSPEHKGEVKAWITERTPDAALRERRLKVYEQGQPKVHYRLKWLRSRAELGKPFFANDQAQFDHVARLWRNGRVRCVRGDLTAAGTLKSFGDLARRSGWTVRVLYMSNAELYFNYDQGSFRENIRSLPFDDRSVILHTQPLDSATYHYIWQDAKPYASWIDRVKSFRDLLYDARLPRQGKFENGAWFIFPPP